MAGCGGREDAKKSIKIGISVYDQYDTFVSEMMKDFNDYATKKEEETGVAINIDTYNASASQSTQNSQVENMITEGCDVICVNLVDRTDPTAIIDLAEKNNIPVIFFNRELVEEDLERWTRLYYVGAQAFESGIMQGELAAEAFLTDQSLDKNGDGIFQYVVLEGEARSSGCNCPYGIFGQHNDRQWSGSRKAGICDRKLEPCTGADKDGTAYVTVRG